MIVRVSLAGKENLDRPVRPSRFGELLRVGEHEVGTLVRRGASGDADGESLDAERPAGSLVDLLTSSAFAGAWASQMSARGIDVT
jgi:hypothetical protein